MPDYVVAASRASRVDGRPLPPWHVADLAGEDPAARVGERVLSLCGRPGMTVSATPWAGIYEANGCPVCRRRARA